MTRRLTGGGGARHGHYSPGPKKTSHYTSSLGSREAVSKEPESEQHEPEGAGGSEGAFELERVEHETGGVFGPERATSEELVPENPFMSEPEADESGGDSSDEESELEPDLDFQIQRREDQHHAGDSGSKTPVQGQCPTDRGGDGRNACHPLPGGGTGLHMGCDHYPP